MAQENLSPIARVQKAVDSMTAQRDTKVGQETIAQFNRLLEGIQNIVAFDHKLTQKLNELVILSERSDVDSKKVKDAMRTLKYVKEVMEDINNLPDKIIKQSPFLHREDLGKNENYQRELKSIINELLKLLELEPYS